MRFVMLVLLPGLCSGQTVLEWTHSKKFTLEVAEKMPAEQYRFKATESEMSFGSLMVHIAVAQAYRFEQVSGVKAPASVARSAGGKLTKEDIIAIVRASFDYVIAVAPALTAAQLDRKYRVDWRERAEATGREIVLNMFTHTAHHRGQAEVYLRLNGIAPPQYLF